MPPKRGFLAIATVALMALAAVISGCGGSSSTSSNGKTNLVLWHMEQPPNRVARFQSIIDDFNRTHPKIHVQQQVQDWNQIYSKIAAAGQSQTQPDMLFTIPDFTTYVKQTGIVQPVTDLVKRLDAQHHFLPAATTPYKDGDQYEAVPLYGMVQMLWYRKDLFRKAGIASAPRTWSELQADAAKLTSGSQHGIALPAGKNLATDQVMYSLMTTAKAQNIYAGAGDQIAFDNPNTMRAFSLYQNLLKYSPSDSANYSWGEPQAAFNNGSAAMAIEKGQYLAPFTKESGRPASDLGCAPIPQPDTNGQPGSIYYSNAAMITTSDPAKKKASEEFLSYLLQPQVYGKFLNAEPGLFLPLTQDGAKAQSWTSDPVISKYRGCVDKMLEQSKSGALFGFTNGYHESIGKISGQNIIAQAIQSIYVGKKPPAVAVKSAQQQMQQAVS
jgi:multiple sugar transport system substrate-binding protein